MIDTTTQERVTVSTDGTAGPYIIVPVSQLNEVRSILDGNSVQYFVDRHAISLNGKPEMAVINLGRGADPGTIQKILDDAS